MNRKPLNGRIVAIGFKCTKGTHARLVTSPSVQLSDRLSLPLPQIEARLASLLPSAEFEPQALAEAMRYSLLAPGKRLRPVLCLESARLISDEDMGVLDAACAIEMVHCFSLIHDDLPAIDNDDFRRGKPTCHKAFGEAVAILAGDALFSLAFEVLSEIGAPPPRVLAAMRELSSCAGVHGLVGGEMLDILKERSEPDLATVSSIHDRKTAALFAASCAIGAQLAGGTEAQITALRNYGRHLGLAFQIADDLLNETGSAAQIGKSVGSDRERGKQTYPAALGIEAARAAANAECDSAIASLKGFANPELHTELARYAVARTH